MSKNNYLSFFCFSIFLCCFWQLSLLGQNEAPQDSFASKVEHLVKKHGTEFTIEKVYVNTDRESYAIGETLQANAFLTFGLSDDIFMGSRIFHLDLISPNGHIIKSQSLLMENGMGRGFIKLPRKGGRYTLRAHTQWMRNFSPNLFFRKTIVIGEKKIEPNITNNTKGVERLLFFPEGGYCVDGLKGKVGFRGIKLDGSQHIEGQVINQHGEAVAFFKELHNGMGHFPFTPKAEENYTVVLDNGQRFAFPKTKNQGYAISLQQEERHLEIRVQCTDDMISKPLYLAMTAQNRLEYLGKLKFDNDPSPYFSIPFTDLPHGVVTLSLLDDSHKVWGKRSFFVPSDESPQIYINAQKCVSETGEDNVIDIQTLDASKKPSLHSFYW